MLEDTSPDGRQLPPVQASTMNPKTWQCAGWSNELAGRPLARKLVGRNVVLFRDQNGISHTLSARCPHRGANLARGTVVDGCIQCPFHGWRFDGSGHCVRVPSQPRSVKISSLARVPSIPTHERDGVLWVWMGSGEPQHRTPPADPACRNDAFARRLFIEPQLLDAPLLTVVENVFDKAHIPFIHAGTFGPNQNTLVVRQRVTLDPDGRSLTAEDDPDSPWQAEPKQPTGLLGWVGHLLGLRKPTAQRARFDVDGGAQIYTEYPNHTYDLFVVRITPADAQQTWLFVESARTRAPHAIGDWVLRRAIRRVFEEGKLETSLILASSGDDPVPASVESDRVGLAARRLCETWAHNSAAAGGRP